MEILGIIPARYNSTRFPGKPLAMIGNLSMIQRVYEQGQQAVDDIYVATDDQRIFNHVKDFGGNVVMTSTMHQSGTDRCREAMDSIMAGTLTEPDIVINIQGDEPFIKAEQITSLISCFDDPETDIATLIKKARSSQEVFDENRPKVVFDNKHFALYFSRSPIPFMRGLKNEQWTGMHDFYRHIGIYAYRRDVLRRITDLGISELETAESLEQLRWLQNGFRIKLAKTLTESLGIDTPADLNLALKFLENE